MSGILSAGNAYSRKLIRAARDLGWDCRLSGGGHLQFNHPAGFRVTAPGTPRDPDHSIKKTLSKLRRLGRAEFTKMRMECAA